MTSKIALGLKPTDRRMEFIAKLSALTIAGKPLEFASKDLTSLSDRITPHNINTVDPVTKTIVQTQVSVKPETILVLVDDAGLVLGYEYEES